MKKIVIMIAPALLLSGCGIYTKYQRPEVASDGLYRTEIGADTTASLAQLRWDELFTDPQLQTLVREGLEANTDLRIARLKVEEAQASLRTGLGWLTCLRYRRMRRARCRVSTAARRRRPTASAVRRAGRSTSSAS